MCLKSRHEAFFSWAFCGFFERVVVCRALGFVKSLYGSIGENTSHFPFPLCCVVACLYGIPCTPCTQGVFLVTTKNAIVPVSRIFSANTFHHSWISNIPQVSERAREWSEQRSERSAVERVSRVSGVTGASGWTSVTRNRPSLAHPLSRTDLLTVLRCNDRQTDTDLNRIAYVRPRGQFHFMKLWKDHTVPSWSTPAVFHSTKINVSKWYFMLLSAMILKQIFFDGQTWNLKFILQNSLGSKPLSKDSESTSFMFWAFFEGLGILLMSF